MKWFLGVARRERQYPLREDATPAKALAHLNLLDAGKPSHAAILLFGKQPQRFLITSEVKCMHFHGTEVLKPIPSYQIYKGTVFELVDQAVDFVMSKINRAVGTRAESNQAPVMYELPHLAVAEAIVNAITHRDYTSNASVQVMLFSDRLEVWNPGELPTALTIGELRLPHASIPRNPLIAEPMFLAHYAEKAGSGILDMFKLCAQANLPPPEFRQSGGQFIQTLNRDWLTDKVLAGFNLNDRQIRMLALVKQLGRVTQPRLETTGRCDRTNDFTGFEGFLLEKGVLEKVGVTGRATHYVISRKTRHKPGKPDIKP